MEERNLFLLSSEILLGNKCVNTMLAGDLYPVMNIVATCCTMESARKVWESVYGILIIFNILKFPWPCALTPGNRGVCPYPVKTRGKVCTTFHYNLICCNNIPLRPMIFNILY